MAEDLARDSAFAVTVADIDQAALGAVAGRGPIETINADLSDPATIRKHCEGFDLIVGALSSRLGLQTLEAVIDAGRPYVDINFSGDNLLSLHDKAAARGVTAVIDCGVAPGMTNMCAGWASTQLDPFERLEIYVGGLPEVRRWPFEYKAAFAPSDAIEEYTRPARMVESGKVVTYPALSGLELLEFDRVGTLEAFNTDGLRTLIETLDVPDMLEKTLRYPGHAELMRMFRELGFFGEKKIDVGGQTIAPLDLTSALVFDDWTYGPNEVDITVCRVIAIGKASDGAPTRLQWDLFDRRDAASGVRSMSRTTGYPATQVARLVADGTFREPGVFAPERLGVQEGVLERVMSGLAERGIDYRFSRTTL